MIVGGCIWQHIYYASSTSGRGPCSLTCDREDRNTQIHVVKGYAAKFSNSHAQQKATGGNTNPWVFVPASGVRHRSLKTKTGLEGKFLYKRKPKKGRANVYKTMHVDLGRLGS